MHAAAVTLMGAIRGGGSNELWTSGMAANGVLVSAVAAAEQLPISRASKQ
jgi:hypothetical protein